MSHILSLVEKNVTTAALLAEGKVDPATAAAQAALTASTARALDAAQKAARTGRFIAEATPVLRKIVIGDKS